MNLDGLLNKYFGQCSSLPIIEMFDSESIYNVYKDIVDILKKQPDIELGILQTLSYCFYEILDNVMIHSMKSCGTVVLKYTPEAAKIQIMVVDDGIGIHRSLAENEKYRDISEADALAQCMHDRVTDGKGMGFGLYSTACLMRQAGIMLRLHSGKHALVSDGVNEWVEEADYWQGTVIYFELYSDKDINPNGVLENRTDVVSDFNNEFLDTEDIEELW
ncbi:MAG: ATP-binding protein [Bacteroides sp.]|nr:ATP-binding protein [Bacteroides sp.]